MLLINSINPSHSVKLSLSTRTFQIDQGDEFYITDQEYGEAKILIDGIGLICLTDEEAEVRNSVKAEVPDPAPDADTPPPVDDTSSYQDPSGNHGHEGTEGEDGNDELAPVPVNCPHTRESLNANVKAELWDLMDSMGIEDKSGSKKVLIERIIDHYRG